ncbi:hypothetical protein NFI96_013316, partial [Prochilodus magdalenae]
EDNYSTYPFDAEPCNSFVRDFGQVFLPTLYSIVFIVGFIGNGLVLCVLAKYYRNSNMMDVCLFNLALSDLLFLISLPFWAHYAATNEWIFGNSMCKAVTAFYMLGFYGSIFFMLLMTVDRYLVTVHAHTKLFFKRQSMSVGIALVVFMWILSLGASFPSIIFSEVTNQSTRTCQAEYPDNTWRKASYIELNILGWILPLSVMGFCYSQIIPTLVTMKSKTRHKAIKLILVLITVFFLFWTPYNVVIFLQFLHYSGYMFSCEWQQDLGLAMQWAETIAFSHCCLNPIIYAFMGQRYDNNIITVARTDDYYNYSDINSSEPCNISVTRNFGQVFLPTLYSIVIIVGFIGNGLVLCVLAKYYRNSNTMDVCLFNLALSDLLFLISLPFWAHYAATNEWIFGKSMCKAVTAFYMIGFYGSIFFMLLMTVDRYLVTVHAHSNLFFKRQSVSVGIALVVFMWVLSLGASLPSIIFSNETNQSTRTCQAEYPDNTWRKASYIELNILGWILPLAVMGFCYSQIIPTLATMKSKTRHKAIKLILVLITVFFLFWTPYNVVIFLHFLHYSGYMHSCEWQENLGLAMQWAETIAFSHCCLNPIIYAFMGQRFKTLVIKTLKEWFPMCFSQCKAIDSQLTKTKSSMSSTRTEITTFL